MDPPPIVDDTGSRFAPITNDDHSGYLWITSILCLIHSSLVILVRLHIKWNMYGADDVSALIATVMQYGQVIPLFVAMKDGLGQTQSLLHTSALENAGRATFVSQIFLILSLSTAKGSVAALMLRLFTRDIKATKKSWILCNLTTALIVIWCIGSIVALSVSCDPSGFLHEFNESCGFQLNRWRVIAAFNIFTELLLMLLPIFFIYPIQMKMYIKLQVVIAFGFRVPVIAFAAAHLHYVSNYAGSNNVSKAIIPALIYQQFELFWSLLAATIPTLKAFMRSFNSGFGMEIDLDGYGSAAYGSGDSASKYYNSPGSSMPLRSLPRNKAGASASGNKSQSGMEDEISAIANRVPKDKPRATASVTSDGSQELIIQREVQWSVYTEDAQTKDSG